MTIELLITIFIAIVGWIWAIAQFCYKRKWQKKDLLVSRRYDAYSQYMRKCEEINEYMRKDPIMINDTFIKSFSEILVGKNQEERNDALIEFNRQLFEYVKQSITPLSIINQELNSLLIIASYYWCDKIALVLNLIK